MDRSLSPSISGLDRVISVPDMFGFSSVRHGMTNERGGDRCTLHEHEHLSPCINSPRSQGHRDLRKAGGYPKQMRLKFPCSPSAARNTRDDILPRYGVRCDLTAGKRFGFTCQACLVHLYSAYCTINIYLDLIGPYYPYYLHGAFQIGTYR